MLQSSPVVIYGRRLFYNILLSQKIYAKPAVENPTHVALSFYLGL
jgi:hypothetical protein